MLRVALVLSLWHAPIPWLHAHDLDGPLVEHLESLSQHVAEFHAVELGAGEQHLEWHLHLVLQWCLNHQLPCPDADDRQPGSDDYVGAVKMSAARANAGAASGQPTARAFLADDFIHGSLAILPQVAKADRAMSAIARARHFFETYGRADSLRDLVGVRLC